MLTMYTKNLEEKGFTLVELIVAIGIGAIFAISVSTLMNSNNHIANRTRDTAVANSFAENKIEELRSRGFLSLSDGTSDMSGELPGELKAPRSASLVISPHTASVKKLNLAITYNELGSPRTYSYTTFVGELGVGQN